MAKAAKSKQPGEKCRGKKYREKALLVTQPSYPLAEAAELLSKLSTTKFDATAEAHVRINADTTQADQLVRTTVNLPHGMGKKVRIAAFVPDDLVNDAKKTAPAPSATKRQALPALPATAKPMVPAKKTVPVKKTQK